MPRFVYKKLCISKERNMQPDRPVLLVDSSYAIIYRYHAVLRWYSFVHSESYQEISKLDQYDWTSNEVFMTQFRRRFDEALKGIMNNFSVPMSNCIFAMDAKRDNLWRTELFPSYKCSRKKVTLRGNNMMSVMRFAREAMLDSMCIEGAHKIGHINAEADDVIAVITKKLSDEDKAVVIITSDKDLMQLGHERVSIVNIQGKALDKCERSDTALLQHILVGDKVDDIPSVFPRCGRQSAAKLASDPQLLDQKLKDDPLADSKFQLNTKLIDLSKIPADIVTAICGSFDTIHSCSVSS